jgi:Glyoxalase-like domain
MLSRNLELRGGDEGLGVKYVPPKAGGRKRKDDADVKWEVTRPEYRNAENTPSAEMYPSKRIDVPFFCHDVTPRVVRVPWDEEDLTKHPSGASGVAAVEVLVPPEKLTAYSTLYSSITGSSPQQLNDEKKKGVSFDLATPTSQDRGPVIKLRVPTSDEDRAWLNDRGIGIREIQISVKGRKGHGEERLASDGIGSSISLTW